MTQCFHMVTRENAAIMGLQDYGLEKGSVASLVVLDANGPVEAVRLRAQRLLVVSKGKVIARREKSPMTLSIPGRPESIDRRF